MTKVYYNPLLDTIFIIESDSLGSLLFQYSAKKNAKWVYLGEL